MNFAKTKFIAQELLQLRDRRKERKRVVPTLYEANVRVPALTRPLSLSFTFSIDDAWPRTKCVQAIVENSEARSNDEDVQMRKMGLCHRGETRFLALTRSISCWQFAPTL